MQYLYFAVNWKRTWKKRWFFLNLNGIFHFFLNICRSERVFRLTFFARHQGFGQTWAKPRLLRSYPSWKNNSLSSFPSFHSEESSYLTKHLHFPADSLLLCPFCYSFGWFPALHQQLSCHLIALLFPPSKWQKSDVTQGRMCRYSSRPEAFPSIQKSLAVLKMSFFFFFLQQICIYCLRGHLDFIQLLPPIRSQPRASVSFLTLTLGQHQTLEKVTQANASFIPNVQIRHLAAWSLLYTLDPVVHTCVVASEGNGIHLISFQLTLFFALNILKMETMGFTNPKT